MSGLRKVYDLRMVRHLAQVLAVLLLGCLELPEPVELPVAPSVDAQMTQADMVTPLADSMVPPDLSMPQIDALVDDMGPLDSMISDAAPPLSVCGNGIVEPGEECDEGGATSACSASCEEIVCGNGRIDPGESCDDGIASAECTAACTLVECGNGILDPGEECDDGIQTGSCSDLCLTIECGNGRVDPGEACDDGNADSNDDCFDDCQVYFPNQWTTVLESNDLNLPGVLLCEGRYPDPSQQYEQFAQEQGRQAHTMWSDEAELWLPFGDDQLSPVRVSVDIYVPDGYDRYARLGITMNEFECDASRSGVTIRHNDRKHTNSDPLVRVHGDIDSGAGGGVRDGSGNPDVWVRLSIVFLPGSGHVRFSYDGQQFEEGQLTSGSQPRFLRFRGGYDRGSNVRAPISFSNLVVERYLP